MGTHIFRLRHLIGLDPGIEVCTLHKTSSYSCPLETLTWASMTASLTWAIYNACQFFNVSFPFRLLNTARRYSLNKSVLRPFHSSNRCSHERPPYQRTLSLRKVRTPSYVIVSLPECPSAGSTRSYFRMVSTRMTRRRPPTRLRARVRYSASPHIKLWPVLQRQPVQSRHPQSQVAFLAALACPAPPHPVAQQLLQASRCLQKTAQLRISSSPGPLLVRPAVLFLHPGTELRVLGHGLFNLVLSLLPAKVKCVQSFVNSRVQFRHDVTWAGVSSASLGLIMTESSLCVHCPFPRTAAMCTRSLLGFP